MSYEHGIFGNTFTDLFRQYRTVKAAEASAAHTAEREKVHDEQFKQKEERLAHQAEISHEVGMAHAQAAQTKADAGLIAANAEMEKQQAKGQYAQAAVVNANTAAEKAKEQIKVSKQQRKLTNQEAKRKALQEQADLVAARKEQQFERFGRVYDLSSSGLYLEREYK